MWSILLNCVLFGGNWLDDALYGGVLLYEIGLDVLLKEGKLWYGVLYLLLDSILFESFHL